MRIAICDDEEIYRIELKTILDKMLANADYDIDTFADGKHLIEEFSACPYDLVFLDIEMPAVDGITLAKMIRLKSENVFIVFLTSHIEYALEGYEVMVQSGFSERPLGEICGWRHSAAVMAMPPTV